MILKQSKRNSIIRETILIIPTMADSGICLDFMHQIYNHIDIKPTMTDTMKIKTIPTSWILTDKQIPESVKYYNNNTNTMTNVKTATSSLVMKDNRLYLWGKLLSELITSNRSLFGYQLKTNIPSWASSLEKNIDNILQKEYDESD